jgi:tetratricopeptide (TPR) repeat protein
MRRYAALLLALLVSAETALLFRVFRRDAIALATALREPQPGPGYRAPLLRLARERDDLFTLERVARVLDRIGTIDERIELHRRLLELAPENPRHSLQLALILAESGRYDEAAPLFQQALDDQP